MWELRYSHVYVLWRIFVGKIYSHFSWRGKISSHRFGIVFSRSWKCVMFTKRKLLVWNRQLSFFAHKMLFCDSALRDPSTLCCCGNRWPLGYKPVDRWFRSPPGFTCSDISSLLSGKQPTTELGVWWPADSFGGPAVSACGSLRRSAHSTLLAGRLFIKEPICCWRDAATSPPHIYFTHFSRLLSSLLSLAPSGWEREKNSITALMTGESSQTPWREFSLVLQVSDSHWSLLAHTHIHNSYMHCPRISN